MLASSNPPRARDQIPTTIHQTWKSESIPDRWLRFQRSWRDLNPDYRYRLWTDADNRRLVADHYPALLTMYDAYPLAIHRADLARYLILDHEGGVYVDLDVECLRPIGPLLGDRRLVFALEPRSHAKAGLLAPRGLSRMIGNAFMASAALHPFWPILLDLAVAAAAQEQVLDATGPLLLTRACDRYAPPDDITVLPSTTVYPLDQEATRSLPGDAIVARSRGAYAIHYWQGSWTRDAVLALARGRIRQRRLL